jgi:hypothetical protein
MFQTAPQFWKSELSKTEPKEKGSKLKKIEFFYTFLTLRQETVIYPNLPLLELKVKIR